MVVKQSCFVMVLKRDDDSANVPRNKRAHSSLKNKLKASTH